MAMSYGAFGSIDETFGVGRQFEARRAFANIRPLLKGINVAPDNGNGASAELNGGATGMHESDLPIAITEPRAATAFLVGDSVSVVAYV